MKISPTLALLAVATIAGCGQAPAPQQAAPATRQLQATQAFYVSAPYASAIRPSSAVINWTTGVPARGQLEYGTSLGSINQKGASEGALATSHHLTMGGLYPGAWYYYRVRCTDAAGHQSVSATKSFRTTW